MTGLVRALALGACLIVAGCQATAADLDGEILHVPVTDASGAVEPILVRVCRPDAPGPARLVVINHGTPPVAADRAKVGLGRCTGEAARWFLARGDAVAFPLRRGYGETGGAYAEANGPCNRVDYRAAGIETARDIDAAVNAVTALPGVRRDDVVVVGQSAGGWGTIAYASLPYPKVGAFIVMAGGRGGHFGNVPDRNCRPDRLAADAGVFGQTARTQMLWIYAANDSFFAPPIAKAMERAFTASGGQVDFEQPGPFGTDGHRLFFGKGGSAVWGPLVARYLATRG